MYLAIAKNMFFDEFGAVIVAYDSSDQELMSLTNFRVFWNNAVWLVKTSHVSFNRQSECFILVLRGYATLKFVWYDIGSFSWRHKKLIKYT